LIDHLLESGVIRVGIRVWPEALFSPPAFRGFSNATTGGALNGFEVDVAHLLAERLGLELELVEAYPPVIARGDWRGQWDIAIASLVPFDPPSGQSQQLLFSEPYAYMPIGLLVPAESNLQTLNGLSGKRVGVLEHSPYQALLATGEESPPTVQGRLLLDQVPADIQIIPVSNLPKAIRRLAGEDDNESPPLDGILGPTPVLRQAVQEEWPVKLAADNLGVLPLAVAVVPQEGLQVDRLLLEVNQILEKLHQRGTLSEASLRWYGQDYSQLPPPTSDVTP
jgi:polar amino acid transport system substrate-binding protein